MEKKRSRGVTIFAWLLIGLNVITLLQSYNFKIYFDLYKSFDRSAVVAIILYTVLSAVIGIAAGFGILKLKEIMRKAAVLINALDVLFNVPLFFISADEIRRYSYSVAVAMAEKTPTSLNIDMLTNVGFYSAAFTNFFYTVLSLLLIFFLTRTKVKEQFQ
ncbi:MAG: hypothetical protein PHI59_01305 [Candidatus Omnitrophica bacterium]|nr:hypothetical protein [Candidatus Omnitrophota bacterium]